MIQSTVTSGTLQYVGLGDVGGGVGSGRYKLGNCAFDSGTTTCTLSGSYVETTDSTHAPGQQGTFAMTLSYPGNGVSPVIAKSITAGSDVLQIVSTDNNVFTLTLFPSVGGHITGLYPDPVFANSIVFSAFLDPDNYGCTGLASGQLCSIGQVGLVPGAIVAGGVKPLLVTSAGGAAGDRSELRRSLVEKPRRVRVRMGTQCRSPGRYDFRHVVHVRHGGQAMVA